MATKLDQINAAITSPVHTTAPLDAHPDALNPFGAVLASEDAPPQSVECYKAGRSALQVVYAATHDISEADRALRDEFGTRLEVDGRRIDRAIPDDRRQQFAADLGHKFAQVAKRFDSHLAVAADCVGKLESDIEKAIQNPNRDTQSVAQAASDIRAYVRALPDDRRMSFLHQAANDGDREVLAAVLQSTPWISGLNRESFAVVRSLAAEKLAPRESSQLAAAQKLHDHLSKAAGTFARFYRGKIPVIHENANVKAIQKLKEGVA
jgi:hypothetical protein